MRATKAVISLAALKNNVQTLKNAHPRPMALCAIVKANAYGHGAVETSKAFLKAGAERLGTACIEEALELKESGIDAPIHILGAILPEEAEAVVQAGFIPFISSSSEAAMWQKTAKKLGRPLAAHLKIDSGMTRLGVSFEKTLELADFIANCPNIILEGAAIHLAKAEELDSAENLQILLQFKELAAQLKSRFANLAFLHAANSASLANGHIDSMCNMARPGLALYGLSPAPELKKNFAALQPALTLKSKLVLLRKTSKGTAVSYGGTYVTQKDTVIGVAPCGYADGYPRLLSNQARAIVSGRSFPIAGRICMDQLMIDLGPSPNVSLYDDIILLGKEPDAWELAQQAQTIAYEILTNIGARVKRVYVES